MAMRRWRRRRVLSLARPSFIQIWFNEPFDILSSSSSDADMCCNNNLLCTSTAAAVNGHFDIIYSTNELIWINTTTLLLLSQALSSVRSVRLCLSRRYIPISNNPQQFNLNLNSSNNRRRNDNNDIIIIFTSCFFLVFCAACVHYQMSPPVSVCLWPTVPRRDSDR